MSDPLPPSVGLGLAASHAQEQFSRAFILALSALAGCAASEPRPDDDSVDWTLSCKLPRRPRLDLQVKSVRAGPLQGDHLPFSLKRKNYDDLRLPNLLAPRLLVVVLLPKETERWLTCDPERLVLRHSAYWHSLAGAEPTSNEGSVTVRIRRTNVLNVEAVMHLMRIVDANGVP